MKRMFDFSKVQPVPAGVYHTQSSPEVSPPYRVHLRLQPNGYGVLVINAATVLHLNPTAAEYAYHFVKGTAPGAAAEEIHSRYRVSRSTALEDYRNFSARVQTLISTPDLDPVTVLDFERVSLHTADLTAPLRLDCALTYRLPAGTQADYAPAKRVDRELSTAEWSQILEKAWQAGIPHVTFTGGEPTLRTDLTDLVARAEAIGQVCGLLTDGLKLTEKSYRDGLLQAGLDHILLILQPGRPESWQAVDDVLSEDIFLTVHLTVRQEHAAAVPGYLERLASRGLKSISLTFADPNVPGADLTGKAAELGLSLKYDLPVPYSSDHPVARELQDASAQSGAGRAWLYVEPDGDVLPAQGIAGRVLGNFLRDPWEKIYRT